MQPDDVGAGTPKQLIVFVPGIGSDRSDRLMELITSTAASGTLVAKWEHGVKPWSIRRTPEQAARNLAAFVARTAVDVEAEDIVLIGHSLGGLIVRAAWLRGRGYDTAGPEAGPAAWTDDVSRIVLLGSPNGGYKLVHWSLLRIVSAVATPFADFAIEHAKSGGYWVTNLRLRWLQAFRELHGTKRPYVVDVVGCDDRIVTSDQVNDTLYLTGTTRVELDDTDHAGLVDLRSEQDEQNRWPTIRRAIFGTPTPEGELKPVSPQPVHFVFHGIRASADDDWITAIKHGLLATGAAVVAPDTGFFSAFEFALPFVRNRKAHEFLEKYGDQVVTHDPANFSFLGHSNGTYMLGRAMQRVPAVRLRNILLAGTVLTPTYDWHRLKHRKQIGTALGDDGGTTDSIRLAVHNERARIDVPVGILSALMNGLWPWNRGIGPGGVRGFRDAEDVVSQDDHFYPKGHAGALKVAGNPARLNEIVGFLTTGEVTDHPAEKPSRLFQTISRIMPFLAWPLVGGTAAALVWLTTALFRRRGPSAFGLVGGPLLVIYLLLRTV